MTSLSTDYVLDTVAKNSRTAGAAFVAVPEPATVGMLGLGALVTLLIRRFKRA